MPGLWDSHVIGSLPWFTHCTAMSSRRAVSLP